MSGLAMLAALAGAAACGGAGGMAAPRLLAAIEQPPAGADEQGSVAPGATIEPVPTLLQVSAERLLGPRLAATGVGCGIVVALAVGWAPALLPWLVLVAVGPVLGYVDLRTRLLPTAIVAPAYAALVVLLVVSAAAESTVQGTVHVAAAALLRALLGWAAMGGFYLALWFIGPPGLGYGDVRLAGLLALGLGYVGWAQLVSGLYLGFVVGGATSLVLVVLRRATLKSQLPFGPAMLLGALLGLVVGPQLAGWVMLG